MSRNCCVSGATLLRCSTLSSRRVSCLGSITSHPYSSITRSAGRCSASKRTIHNTCARFNTAVRSSSGRGLTDLRAVNRLSELLRDALKVLEGPKAPQESEILQSLATCEDFAEFLKNDTPSITESAAKDTPSPAASLLFLDEKDLSRGKKVQPTLSIGETLRREARQKLSSTALQLVQDHRVFLTPDILKLYVKIQTALEKPESLAKIFSLYARKPQPIANTNPVRYSKPSPNHVASAIPLQSASLALDAAIHAENFPLCLDIIDSTVGTAAFRRQKFTRQALLPALGFALAPVAAYSLASQLAIFQQAMSSEMATTVGFAGILTYVGATATIGMVAITTSNDQMQRITWASGIPLRERWVREEERAFIDRVACAWGFKDSWKRGQEVGQDWEALKELTGLRGMMLDRTDLLDGME